MGWTSARTGLCWLDFVRLCQDFSSEDSRRENCLIVYLGMIADTYRRRFEWIEAHRSDRLSYLPCLTTPSWCHHRHLHRRRCQSTARAKGCTIPIPSGSLTDSVPLARHPHCTLRLRCSLEKCIVDLILSQRSRPQRSVQIYFM